MTMKTHKTVAIMAALSIFVSLGSVLGFAQPQAPDFSLRAVNGPAVTAESLRGNVAVLAFGASWLPLTRNQMEGLKKLADQYASRGVAVYWVSTESDSVKSKNFFGDEEIRSLGRKYKISVFRDPDGSGSHPLGVGQLPSTVILYH